MDFRDELHPKQATLHWTVQRIGWLCMAVVIGLALAGFLGSGPISENTKEASAGDVGAEIAYQRWTRQTNPQELRVTVDAPGATASELTVTISETFAEQVNIQNILPQGESAALTDDGIVYTWPVRDWSEPVSVWFEYRPRVWRQLEGAVIVRVGDAPPISLTFTQIVFP